MLGRHKGLHDIFFKIQGAIDFFFPPCSLKTVLVKVWFITCYCYRNSKECSYLQKKDHGDPTLTLADFSKYAFDHFMAGD